MEAADGADLLVVGSSGRAASPRPCSARSASTACITRPARCWSSAANQLQTSPDEPGKRGRPGARAS